MPLNAAKPGRSPSGEEPGSLPEAHRPRRFPVYASSLPLSLAQTGHVKIVLSANHCSVVPQPRTSAMKLLRGLLFGLFTPAGFFVALSALIEPLGIGLGFAAATAAALVAQGLTLLMLRPGTLSG